MKFEELDLLSFGNTTQIVGMIFQGNDSTILCPFPSEKLDSPIAILEMDRPQWDAVLHQTDVVETEVLARTPDGALVKSILRKSQRQIEQGTSWKVWKRDAYRCRYCAADDVPLTVDHLVLWEDGGPSIEQNLVSACKKCNKIRGNMQYAEWLQHPRYLSTRKNLTPEVRAANEALVQTLDKIQKRIHVRSR